MDNDKKYDYAVGVIALVAAMLALVSLAIPASDLTNELAAGSAIFGLAEVLLALYVVYIDKEDIEEDVKKEDKREDKEEKREEKEDNREIKENSITKE